VYVVNKIDQQGSQRFLENLTKIVSDDKKKRTIYQYAL